MPSQPSAPSDIRSLLHETRVFPPPPAVSAAAAVKSLDDYRRAHERSVRDPEGFWGEAAKALDWFTPWSKVLEWEPKVSPDCKWFVGGTTNLCHNCVDRQVNAGLGGQTAIIWEGEPKDPAAGGAPEIRRLTYDDLLRETQRVGAALKSMGVKKGDIVTIYMPMVPELAIAMLACARIGAAHSVIFGGFSAIAIADRVRDSKSRVILTADGGLRRGKIVPLKDNVDAACATLAGEGAGVEHVLVFKRCGNAVAWDAKRDRWWQDASAAAPEKCPCEPMASEDLLFVLYTSGSTGKPKGILHTTGGYMVFTYLTSKLTFDLRASEKGKPTSDVFWCTADCGWVTGHSYVVYGVLPNRVPSLMYEGAPDFPAQDRFWEMIARHKVTQFYTAPTAIRAFMKWGDHLPAKHDLSSVRILGTVGEPINPEAWMWYRKTIGGERCPIVDTWWQTETGGHMITPLPGATPTKPGSCTLPFFGVDAAIVNERGEEQPPNAGGLLVIRKPWPAMLRGILNDRQRFLETYFSRVRTADGVAQYFSGDGARRDEDGYFWVMGRVDDVINVAGHRLGTMEIESALVSYPGVAEAAVVGVNHELKGTGIAAFVTLKEGAGAKILTPDDALREALKAHVGKEIGAIARPDAIRFTRALPKTRSGKIMRRLLRAIAEGKENVGDTTTLEDYGILAKLKESEEG